jgi:hypothetical protein
VTQPTFEDFRPTEPEVPPSRLEFAKGSPFEFESRRKMVQELGSSTERSGNPMT